MKNDIINLNYKNTLKNFDVQKLTPECKKELETLSNGLKVDDPTSITNYGSEISKIMSDNADSMIDNMKTNKVDELGSIISNLFADLNMLNIDDVFKENSFKDTCMHIPILRSFIRKSKNFMAKYDSVKNNLDDITDKINATQVIAIRDNNNLQVSFNNNNNYICQLGKLIAAGELKKQEFMTELNNISNDPGNHEQYAPEMYKRYINHLEKKLDDLYRIQKILEENQNQIQIVQFNNVSISEKSSEIKSMMIPLWKSQICLAAALGDQKTAAEIQEKMSDATNNLFIKESELLHNNSISIAKENERSIISTEAIEKSRKQLIDTIEEVKKIHDKGYLVRLDARKKLSEVDEDFKKHIKTITENNMVDDEHSISGENQDLK